MARFAHAGPSAGDWGGPTALAVADVNRDGKTDLVSVNSNTGTPSGSLGVLIGRGNGTFHSAVNFPTGFCPSDLVIAELNRDGRADLVTANFNGPSVSVFLNTGH